MVLSFSCRVSRIASEEKEMNSASDKRSLERYVKASSVFNASERSLRERSDLSKAASLLWILETVSGAGGAD